TIGVLDDLHRLPVNLSLTTQIPVLSTGPLGLADFARAANLSIDTGASIIGEPGAKIALNSNSRLWVDGSIVAPAGTISLGLNAGLSEQTYFADQGIWLGSNAHLFAPGFARTITDDAGRISGSVLAGGTITIAADRGFVTTSTGSSIDVSGVATD